MSDIIAISGKKNAGKSTVAKFLLLRQLKRHESIHDFSISEDGEATVVTYEPTNNQLITGVVDFNRIDEEFLLELFNNVWPLGRISSNAEELKRFLVGTMEVQPKLVYGSKEEKLGPTQYTWRQMPIPPGKRSVPRPELSTLDDFLSGREIMQYFGQLFREMDPDFHTKKVMTVLTLIQPKQAYIDDLRYKTELDFYAKENAKFIRLTRGDGGDSHESEVDLKDSDFEGREDSVVIDNAELTVKDTLDLVDKQMEHSGL